MFHLWGLKQCGVALHCMSTSRDCVEAVNIRSTLGRDKIVNILKEALWKEEGMSTTLMAEKGCDCQCALDLEVPSCSNLSLSKLGKLRLSARLRTQTQTYDTHDVATRQHRFWNSRPSNRLQILYSCIVFTPHTRMFYSQVISRIRRLSVRHANCETTSNEAQYTDISNSILWLWGHGG